MSRLSIIYIDQSHQRTEGEATVPWPPSDPKNVKQNQAVSAKAKLVFREYLGFALDFDFPVKNHSSLISLAGRNLDCTVWLL